MSERFEQLKKLILNSPTQYHFVAYARKLLTEKGFTEVIDNKINPSIPNKGFFIRDDRCLACWNTKGTKHGSFIWSHVDSPSLILKPVYKSSSKTYCKCRPSTYGGGLWHSWLGRDLKLCGKIYVSEKGVLKPVLYDSKRAIGFIPFMNDNSPSPSYNIDEGLSVILSTGSKKTLAQYIADDIGVDPKNINNMQLRFIDANPPKTFSDIIMSQKLDDLVCTFSGLTGFLETEPCDECTSVFVAFDNEEIGSSTQCGGKADIINDVIKLIIKDEEEQRLFKRHSIGASFDVVHATHPNYLEKTNPTIYVELGTGIALSTDDGCCNGELNEMIPFFQRVFKKANPELEADGPMFVQYESGGGSTVGAEVESRSGIKSMDIGQSVFAMHSIREMASLKDLDYCCNFCSTFYTMTPDEWK